MGRLIKVILVKIHLCSHISVAYRFVPEEFETRVGHSPRTISCASEISGRLTVLVHDRRRDASSEAGGLRILPWGIDLEVLSASFRNLDPRAPGQPQFGGH